MKTIRFALLLLGTGMLLTTASAAETVPALVNYQGLLVNPDNTPLANGNYQVQFRIWDQAQNGNLIWGPQSNVVALYNGQFNVLLGPSDSASRSLADAFREASRYLEIQVSNSPPIAPRQQILSAPFALNARSLNGTNWSAVFDNGDPATGKIPGSKIAAGAITSSQIADGSIAMVDLGILNQLSASDGDPTNAVYVDASGNVGIGTLTPSELLHVYHGDLKVQGYSLAPPLRIGFTGSPYSLLSSNRLVLAEATSMGSGTVAPTIEFKDSDSSVSRQASIKYNSDGIHVTNANFIVANYLWAQGHVYFPNLLAGTTAGATLVVYSDGDVRKVTSSRRYKDRIEPAREDFAKILELEAKKYVRREDPRQAEVGYIAEDMDALGLKDLTVYDKEGRPDAIDYQRLLIYVNEVVKQHQGTIKKQREEMEALKADLAELKKLIGQSR
jgi:hypothetical protein